MQEPSFPADEAQRLAVLRALQILDTPAEARFDRITRIAKELFQVPIALISLIDVNRQWFKSCVGLEVSQTERNISFCGHAILNESTLYVPDTALDPRFNDNPLVTNPPSIRFYAGAPLKVAETSAIGTLCIIDVKPRQLSTAQLNSLRDLADWAQQELNLVKINEAVAIINAQRERLKAVFNNVADGIIVSDADGIIESVNPAAEGIFGYTNEQLQGMSVGQIMPGISASEHVDVTADQAPLAQEDRIEGEGRTKAKGLIPIEYTMRVAKIDNQSIYFSIVRDITDRRKIERLKNEFVCAVSHELRTPLTSISGALALLASGKICQLQGQAQSLTEIASRNCDRLTRLVNDILDVEKIEAGKIDFELAEHSLCPLIEQAIQANQAFANTYRVTIRFECREPTLASLVDADRFDQVMANLLSNAIKFSPVEAEVVVRLSEVKRRARIEVVDQGPGIPQDFEPHLFEKFMQADTLDDRKKIGTGLGLNIAKAIVQQFDGTIGFIRGEEKGVCFFFELPLVEVP